MISHSTGPRVSISCIFHGPQFRFSEGYFRIWIVKFPCSQIFKIFTSFKKFYCQKIPPPNPLLRISKNVVFFRKNSVSRVTWGKIMILIHTFCTMMGLLRQISPKFSTPGEERNWQKKISNCCNCGSWWGGGREYVRINMPHHILTMITELRRW